MFDLLASTTGKLLNLDLNRPQEDIEPLPPKNCGGIYERNITFECKSWEHP